MVLVLQVLLFVLITAFFAGTEHIIDTYMTRFIRPAMVINALLWVLGIFWFLPFVIKHAFN